MQANFEFQQFPDVFWANLRAISPVIGYTQNGQVRRFTPEDIQEAFSALSGRLKTDVTDLRSSSDWTEQLVRYSHYRADVLNAFVESRLMTAERAKHIFTELYQRLEPQQTIPMNKQSGNKKQPAYFTAIVQMLIEEALAGRPCDYNPHVLPMFTHQRQIMMTQSRRMDGCFPSCLNPIAVWEIKEYYYTTTFGSRIADGVYETTLDGFELNQLKRIPDKSVHHLLMVDAYETWWVKGKSYLCRLVDLLHMGYVDEVLFGAEVIERLPLIVAEWVKHFDQQVGNHATE